jgi:hypothetical protein
MFQPQAVQIEWYKDNRLYIRTAMPFGPRLNLKPFEVFEVHFLTTTTAYTTSLQPRKLLGLTSLMPMLKMLADKLRGK